jgi:hypothetical protein
MRRTFAFATLAIIAMIARAAAILAAVCLLGSFVSAQLPDLSWTCPMHPDVLDARKGKCGICGMDLEPIRLVSVYTCPIHAVIEQSTPGKCRICARDLVQKTAALTFTCAGQRNVSQLQPGKCADGSAMIARYTARAHGDHNPKHGGIFFMAPDNWHHLEGTYPAPGRFRVYVYDDFSRPLDAARARRIRGRVVTKEAFDAKSGTTRELSSTPLVLARNGAFLEARIERLPLPAKMTVKISFSPDVKESRFDFAFAGHTQDVPAAPRTTDSAAKQGAPVASASARETSDVLRRPSTGSGRPELVEGRDKPLELLATLKERRAEVEGLLERGTLGAIYAPALQAKDLALQIQAGSAAAPRVDQDAVETSVKQIVLAAYQLDNYGDLGDGEKVRDAYQRFTGAISDLDALVTEQR